MKQTIKLSIFIFLFSTNLVGQDTTIYRQVQIQNLYRNVAISVPSSYTAGTNIPLIVGLHGFSMSANSLESYLKTFAYQQQIMIVNIDGAGNRHDDQLSGQEINVILSTLDSMKNWYSIDTNNILLFGFSYGGRESLYFGSTYPTLFSGIITHSAAIQNTFDVNNQLPVPWPQPFKFGNMSQIPICNCMGSLDINFGTFIQQFQSRLDTLSNNDTIIIKNGIGHTIYYNDFFNDLENCWQFIQRQNLGPTGLNEINMQKGNHFYPNPSGGKFYASKGELNLISVKDVNGKSMLYNFKDNCLTLDGEPGVRFLLYEHDGALKSQKIILQ